MKAFETIEKIKPSGESGYDVSALRTKCYEAMDDDLNTPVLLSHLFDAVRVINSAADGTEKLSSGDLESLKTLFRVFVFDILGLVKETGNDNNQKQTDDLIKILIELRQEAKARKDFASSDKIRNDLKNAGIVLKDTKNGVEWEREN